MLKDVERSRLESALRELDFCDVFMITSFVSAYLAGKEQGKKTPS